MRHDRELDVDLVRSVVEERVAWEKASLPRAAAAARIGWHWSDLVRMGKEGRITIGRGDRYLIADLDAMAAEADGEQYVTAQVAATDVLEIRASDWKYVAAAGGFGRRTSTRRRWGGTARSPSPSTGSVTSARCGTCPASTGRPSGACRRGRRPRCASTPGWPRPGRKPCVASPRPSPTGTA
ncbi:hypothetical protein ACFW5V_31275 [Streptomyces sp. NPDC058762]|uniref:hypothetical protein n=1 Tax=Streptomyces sp. NPDC058762 TaxID=3346629 RepID=UPI0036C4C302